MFSAVFVVVLTGVATTCGTFEIRGQKGAKKLGLMEITSIFVYFHAFDLNFLCALALDLLDL